MILFILLLIFFFILLAIACDGDVFCDSFVFLITIMFSAVLSLMFSLLISSIVGDIVNNYIVEESAKIYSANNENTFSIFADDNLSVLYLKTSDTSMKRITIDYKIELSDAKEPCYIIYKPSYKEAWQNSFFFSLSERKATVCLPNDYRIIPYTLN